MSEDVEETNKPDSAESQHGVPASVAAEAAPLVPSEAAVPEPGTGADDNRADGDAPAPGPIATPSSAPPAAEVTQDAGTEPPEAPLDDEDSPAPSPVGEDEDRAPTDAEPIDANVEEPVQASLPAELLASVDVDRVQSLVDALEAFQQKRESIRGGNAKSLDHLMWCVCLVLALTPHELGSELAQPALHAKLQELLNGCDTAAFPEADACLQWLNCLADGGTQDAVDSFAVLADHELWPPVASLVWRALVHFGDRGGLAKRLPGEGDMSLFQADAWLDAALSARSVGSPVRRVTGSEDDLLPPGSASLWRQLLGQECLLACGGDENVSEATLREVAAAASSDMPRTYEETVVQRLSARATAALVRYRLSKGRGDEGILDAFPANLLPAWEMEYLRGLVMWRLDDVPVAKGCLERALELNPHQGMVRLALAALPVGGCSDRALEILDIEDPSREVLLARAALLARSHQYDAAEEAMQSSEREQAPCEPLRATWATAVSDREFRRAALRAALAESRREWSAAEIAWREACKDKRRGTLAMSRQLFAATTELELAPAGEDSRRVSRVRRERERVYHQLGRRPLVGTETFFRGVAVKDSDPTQSERDLISLSHRHSWVESEQSVGGGRLVALGNELARLGRFDSAAETYEHAASCGADGLDSRLALCKLCLAIDDATGADAIESALVVAAQGMPESPFPFAVAAAGLLMNGHAEASSAKIDRAVELGASESLCESLRAIGDIVEGTPHPLAESVLRALHASREATAILRLLAGEGELAIRLREFVEAVGEKWVSSCPVDVDVSARSHVLELCDAGEWDEADRFLAGLDDSGASLDPSLRAFVQLRRALTVAIQGELAEGERLLMSLASSQ